MTRAAPLPSVKVLEEWFFEDPPGVLCWRKDYIASNNKVRRAGTVAGVVNNGRYVISLHGQPHYRSHLIYKMHIGQDARGRIDHINQNAEDDRFENLRHVTDALSRRRIDRPEDRVARLAKLLGLRPPADLETTE